LTLAIVCWGGNFVIGKWDDLNVPPVALSFWRHVTAFAVVAPFLLPSLRRDWPEVRPRLGMFALWSGLFVLGNTLVYFSVLGTSVINATLINAGVPVTAAFFSWLIVRDLINRWQALGIALAFAGIAIVATRADLGILLGLRFGWGDLCMAGAITSWALYMVLLKRAGIQVSAGTLMCLLTLGGTLWLVPAYAVEVSLGYSMQWSWFAVFGFAYAGLISTIFAWGFWNFGTLRLGPNRASAFMCLHPISGAVLGMIFFGETLQPFHLLGTALVLSGVVLVSRAYVRRAPA
jgi:drug/metabolite transporter (DMT)-like permease